MLSDAFKARYTTIPFASFVREHYAGNRTKDIETLSHVHREMELMLVRKGAAVCISATASIPSLPGI